MSSSTITSSRTETYMDDDERYEHQQHKKHSHSHRIHHHQNRINQPNRTATNYDDDDDDEEEEDDRRSINSNDNSTVHQNHHQQHQQQYEQNHHQYQSQHNKMNSSDSIANDDDDDDYQTTKEYNKKLLISLGMLLPAIAAIIGVMAWAISAEVVLGAKRETARRLGTDGNNNYLTKISNRYDYTRFTSAPLLPQKEMLVGGDHRFMAGSSNDHNDGQHQNGNLNALQKHLEELSKEYLSRRMDSENNENSLTNQQITEIKNRLTHENLSQLFAKLLNNHKLFPNNGNGSNSNGPRIVVVAPIAASHSSSSSSSSSSSKQNSSNRTKHVFTETRVTTSKPKALELKIASSDKNGHNQIKSSSSGSSSKATLKNSIKRKVPSQPKQTHPKIQLEPKRKTSNQIVIHSEKRLTSRNIVPKNITIKPKSKAYEKDIDMLLQKIEKLEKQKIYPAANKIKPNDNVQQFVINNKKHSPIADKIKKFMDSAPKDLNEFGEQPQPQPSEQHHQQSPQMETNQWEGMAPPMVPPPMPPPMPPMPFMPFMAPPPMPAPMPMTVDHQQQQQQPMDPMMIQDPQQQQQQQAMMQQQYGHPNEIAHSPMVEDPNQRQQQYYQQQQPQPQAQPIMDNSYMQQQQQPMLQPQPQYQNPYPQSPQLNYAPQPEMYPQQQPQQQAMQASNQINSYVPQPPMSNQPTQSYNSIMTNEMEPEQKPKKTGILRRFQFSKIFDSVRPKKKKAKKQQQQQQQQQQEIPRPMGTDLNQMNMPPPMTAPGGPPPPFDPMMSQESQYHSAVDRGYKGGYPMEPAGMQVRFGGGPLGGGSQVKVNPMAILKTLAFPLMKRPPINLNGKVVFGVVLENGVGGPTYYKYKPKPKTVFQHYSTGRIKT